MKYFSLLFLIFFSTSFSQGLPEEILEELNVTGSVVTSETNAYTTNLNIIESYLGADGMVHVSGTYDLVNESNLPTQPFHHVIYGGLKGDGYLLKYPLFDGLRGEAIILDANETRTQDFSLLLDDMTMYGDMGVEVKLERVYGSSIHKTTKRIEVEGAREYKRLGEIYNEVEAVFSVGRKEFNLLSGPTIYKNEDILSLSLSLPKVPFNTLVSPKVSIYEESYFNEPTEVLEKDSIVLSTEESVRMNFLLPKNLKPAVYPIKIEFESSDEGIYIPNLYGRYIIGGSIAGVISMDIHGDELISGIGIDVSGLPPDIVNPDRRNIQDIDVKTLVFDLKNNIIDKQVSSIRLGNFNRVEVEFSEELKKEKLQKIYIELSSNGEIIDTYEQYIINPSKSYIKEISIAGIALILIIFIIIMIIIGRNKKRVLFAPLALLFMFISFNAYGETLQGGVTLYSTDLGHGYYYTDYDYWNYPTFFSDSGIVVNVNGGSTEGCHAPGKIMPFSVSVSYALCGNVPLTDQGENDNYQGAFDITTFVLDDWFDKSDLDNPTTSDTFKSLFDDDYFPSSFSIEKATELISIAEGTNGDEVYYHTGTNAGEIPGNRASSYMSKFYSELGTPLSINTTSVDTHDGSGSIDLSVVLPEKEGNYRVYFYVKATHKVGKSTNVSYVDITVCGKHDACVYMAGDQYVDNSGVLRDEDGSILEGYTVQTISGDSQSGLEIKDQNDDPLVDDFAFHSVCNYCPLIEDRYVWNSSSSDKPTYSESFWDNDNNSWIDIFSNLGDLNLYSEIHNYFTLANTLKSAESGISLFQAHNESDSTFSKLRKDVNYFSYSSLEKNSSFIVHNEGGEFKFLDTSSSKVSVGNGKYVFRHELPKYTLSEMLNGDKFSSIMDRFSNPGDTDYSDTYIFQDIDYYENPSYPQKVMCTIYEDYCTTIPGIQFIAGNSEGFVELYQRESDGTKSYLSAMLKEDVTEEGLCGLPPNSCPNLSGYVFNPTTEEVFDANGDLTPYVYRNSKCQNVCSNLNTHTYENDSVYNELGEATDHSIFVGGLCVLYCPNTNSYKYDESNGDVYGTWSEEIVSGKEYNFDENICKDSDSCDNVLGYQDKIVGSSPPKAKDENNIYTITDSVNNICEIFTCPGGGVLDTTYGTCRNACTNISNYTYEYYDDGYGSGYGEVYDENGGDLWDYLAFESGLCTQYCPYDPDNYNSYNLTYDETTNVVYDSYIGEIDPNYEYDPTTDLCTTSTIIQCNLDHNEGDPVTENLCALWTCDPLGNWIINDELCNVCSNLPSYTINPVTKEVFDGSGELSVDHTAYSNKLCTLSCPNDSSWSYDEITNNVYTDITETLKNGFLFDVSENSCQVIPCNDDHDDNEPVTDTAFCPGSKYICKLGEWEIDEGECDEDKCTNNDDFPGIQGTIPTNCQIIDNTNSVCECLDGYTPKEGKCVPDNACSKLPEIIGSGVFNLWNREGTFVFIDPSGDNDPVGVYNKYFKGLVEAAYGTDPSAYLDVFGYIEPGAADSCSVSICPADTTGSFSITKDSKLSTTCYNTKDDVPNKVEVKTFPNFIKDDKKCNIIWAAQGPFTQLCNVLIDGEPSGSGRAGVIREDMDKSSKKVEVVCSDGATLDPKTITAEATCRMSPDFNQF